jgi:hypothetical protein
MSGQVYPSDDFVSAKQDTKVEGDELYKHHTEFRSRGPVEETRSNEKKQLSGAKYLQLLTYFQPHETGNCRQWSISGQGGHGEAERRPSGSRDEYSDANQRH